MHFLYHSSHILALGPPALLPLFLLSPLALPLPAVSPYRVGVRRPNVEVRFTNLHAETEVYVDLSRNLPGLSNAIRNGAEVPPRP